MEEHRYIEIQNLVNNFDNNKISFEEFDQLVSEDEYREWSLETNRRIHEKVSTYLNSKDR